MMTVRVVVPGWATLLMAHLAEAGGTLIARSLHMHAEEAGANDVGAANLRATVARLMAETVVRLMERSGILAVPHGAPETVE